MRIQRITAAHILARRRAVRAHVQACFDLATSLAIDPTAVVEAGWP